MKGGIKLLSTSVNLIWIVEPTSYKLKVLIEFSCNLTVWINYELMINCEIATITVV